MKPLPEIVKARMMRQTGHVLKQMEDRRSNVAMKWIPEDGKRNKRKTTRLYARRSQKIFKASE